MKLRTLALAVALTVCAVPAFAVGSLADVTIYDRASGRILPTYFSDGRWYVAGKPGNEYEIRIRNQSGGDVLAVTSVDGVNVVSGETAAPGQTGYVLASGSYLPIKGWRKDMSKVAAFYFTRLDDSYAARTGRPDNVGVIGVAVFRRKVEPPVVLEDERSRRDDSAADSAAGNAGAASAPAPRPSARAESAQLQKSLGTGHGRIQTSQVRYTNFERASETPDEVVAIWYDSRVNLAARGVIPAPVPAPRDPQPFPANFVPDPPPR
ncbi:MAG: hypothetical protein ABI794_00730 [Betaproteobacteria bacterium]